MKLMSPDLRSPSIFGDSQVQMEEEESQFFDARDDVSSASDSCSSLDLLSGFLADKLESVEERRRRFMAWMRFNSMFSPRNCCSDLPHRDQEQDQEQEQELEQEQEAEEDGETAAADQRRISEIDGRDSSSSSADQIDGGDDPVISMADQRSNSTASTRRRRSKWLRRLGIAACMINGQDEADVEEEDNPTASSSWEENSTVRIGFQRVKVRMSRKPSKEFSGLFSLQEIRAHKGAILAVKFSPDGRFLATGGEDGVVRVWAVGRQSLDLCKKMTGRTTDSTFFVVPEEVCRISDQPIHEFPGHSGDVLDLAWSKNNNLLLSSSTDKTARLRRIGRDESEKVFSHGNYVTCVQFDPKDEGFFVSSSIDGKIRVWEISSRHVVKWVDVREIVTAVCFNPTCEEIVVGTISGRCLFYDSSGRRLQLVSVVPNQGKKKPGCNRITSFQFCPTDAQKLLVSSADSQVRILEEHTVVSKFQGIRNSGSQIAASYTSDGRYVVSGSEDSEVYIWSTAPVDCRRLSWPFTASAPATSATSSYERFPSARSYMAVPWPAPPRPPPVDCPFSLLHSGSSAPHCGFVFSEFLRGAVTWPEEKLPPPPPRGRPWRRRSRTCGDGAAAGLPHAWGRVIVTAGWDGRIRSFHNYGLPVAA
ncbi:uncharacterized protein LOC144716571 [Wolffia australiana]